jgi:hypothetical protein
MQIMRACVYAICLMLAAPCFAGSAAREAVRQLTTEKPGSPYRWVTESDEGGKVLTRVLLGKSAPSVADATVTADILKNIAALEAALGATAPPQLLEVRQLPKSGGRYQEIWIVTRAGGNIAYTVSMQAATQGGVDLDVQGPWE